MRKDKWLGWIMIVFGLDALTPPYPSPADTLLWIIIGKFTGTNHLFRQVITGFNPLLWNWDIAKANSGIFVMTALLVYIISFLILLKGIDIIGNKSYLVKLKNKFKKFIS